MFDGSFSGSGKMVNFPLDSFFTAVGQNGSGTATAGFKFGKMVNFPLDSFFTAVGQNGSGTATAGFKFGGDLNGINFYANTQVKNVHIAGLVFPEAHGKIDMSGSVLHLTLRQYAG